MANITINATPTRVQYTATNLQTVFSYTFPIKASSDLEVYKRAAGSTPDDDSDILILTTDYTVTGANTAAGGTVVLVSGATTGDIVTIIGDKPIDRTAIYDQSVTLSKADLNNDFNDEVMFDKQIETIADQITPKYERNELVGNGVRPDKLFLPMLEDGQIWQGRGSIGETPDDIVAVDASGLGFAPDNATYITQTPSAGLTNEQALSLLGTGILKSTTGTGVVSIAVGGTDYQQVLSGLAITAVTAASGDKVLIQDISDSDKLKTVTVQSIANLASGAVTSVNGTTNEIDVSPTTGAVVVGLPNSVRIATSILDANSVAILGFFPNVSAVNYLGITNATTGNPPTLNSIGSDTNIDMWLVTKGTGHVVIQTAHTTGPLSIYSGTGSQHLTNLAMANTSASRTATFPDFDGTFVLRNSTGILDSSGLQILQLANVASAVNYFAITNAATGFAPGLFSIGSDSNISMTFTTKGTGIFTFAGGATDLFDLQPVVNAVNHIQINNSITGNAVPIYTIGTDTNIGMNLITKGTGILTIAGSGGTTNMFSASNVASAVNYLATSNAATGGAPSLSVVGSDTNIGMLFNVKGTGGYIFSGNDGINFAIGTSSAGANYIQINNAATANAPTINIVGTDTNIGMNLVTKGTGIFEVLGSGGTTIMFTVSNVASAVNYLALTNASTGNPAGFIATGTDSNIGAYIAAKGTGNIALQTSALTAPLVIYNGTASQHSTTFTMANTAAARTFGMPDYNIVWPATQGGAGTKLTNDGAGNLTWT